MTGTLQAGQIVTPGTLGITGTTLAVTYRWRSCAPGGAPCVLHQNTATPEFRIPAGAAGRQLQVIVRAVNSLATAERQSAFSAVVAPVPVVVPARVPAAATFGASKKPKVTATKSSFKVALNQSATCRADGASCLATIAATFKQSKAPRTAATGKVTIATGKTGALNVTLTKSAAKALRKKGKLAIVPRQDLPHSRWLSV